METSIDDAGSVNLAHWLRQRALADPDLPAVRQGELQLSYRDLDHASAAFAQTLRSRGVNLGDRVALIAPNVAWFPIAYYAILRLGAIVVPLNPLLKAGEIGHVWRDSGAGVAVVFATFAAEAAQAAETTGTEVVVVTPDELRSLLSTPEPAGEVTPREAGDTAVILYTSGTTGQPKGAELSFANLRSNVTTTVETLFGNGPEDVLFGGLPLFHSFGQTCALNASVAGGSCLTLLPKFEGRQALDLIAADRVTVFLGVPTMYMALLAAATEADDTSTVRLGVSGGASLPVEVLRGVEERFGFSILEGYGLSETSPVASFNHPDAPIKPGSVGMPIRGVEFALHRPRPEEAGGADQTGEAGQELEVEPGEIGEIVIRGENVMTGYWNDPEASAQAMRGGWFHTGDLATRDPDGYYFIVDRVKDLIIRNGFNVYPREVEEVLYAHPDVAEAAVVGVPDPERGEEIAALVTVHPGAEVGAEELRDWVAARIAAYKYPRIIAFGPIPKGPTGKMLKREITIPH